MPQLTVQEASTAYIRAMRNIAPAGDAVCEICWTFIPPQYSRCLSCDRQPNHLRVVVPITYSEHLGQMHHALRAYKDGLDDVRSYAMPRLAAILWRFLEAHEGCVTRAAGVGAFDVVTSVPSSSPSADETRAGLRTIVQWSEPVTNRYERVLLATGDATPGRTYSQQRYVATRRIDGQNVLLIDDTWTSGGHAQSAAYALHAAGGETVALVVIGRHLRPDWEVVPGVTSGDLLDELPAVFDWTTCAVH